MASKTSEGTASRLIMPQNTGVQGLDRPTCIIIRYGSSPPDKFSFNFWK